MSRLSFPTIFLLGNNVEPDELPVLESQIPSLTYDIHEAEIVLGKIWKKERALFELRRRKVVTTELPFKAKKGPPPDEEQASTASSNGEDRVPNVQPAATDQAEAPADGHGPESAGNVVKVVKLAWFRDSVAKGQVLPLDESYLLYQGRKGPNPDFYALPPRRQLVPKRGREDGRSHRPLPSQRPAAPLSHAYAASAKRTRISGPIERPPLLRETTSEHDMGQSLPPVPDFLHTTYSCQRPTPVNPPNARFVEELSKVRTLRVLEGDRIGIRSYSTAIASISAYPHMLTCPPEVARLPGCGPKIAELFREWKEDGRLTEVENANTDAKLSVLKLFYHIWGVAETTAREFYSKGWRDLDDVVEYGWNSLTRVQQIGVKFYDEFQSNIPRHEVETIADIILAHANKRRSGYQMVIAGGYRRGKTESGDVDVLLSHPDPAATENFIDKLVVSLESDEFITHTLTLSTRNSERGQVPLAWKGVDGKAGSGFDTLDKALVVWQDPNWDTASLSKNPHPHRRVDIIVTPWSTAGCALLGWTGGTTFERDLRRYCKKEKSLKFDSSGIRNRTDGSWVDLESGPDGRPAPDMVTAEKRVFEGLGLVYQRPEERCTG